MLFWAERGSLSETIRALRTTAYVLPRAHVQLMLFDAADLRPPPPTTFIAYQTRPMDNENGVAPFGPGFPHHLGLAACEIWRRILWSKEISVADHWPPMRVRINVCTHFSVSCCVRMWFWTFAAKCANPLSPELINRIRWALLMNVIRGNINLGTFKAASAAVALVYIAEHKNSIFLVSNGGSIRWKF